MEFELRETKKTVIHDLAKVKLDVLVNGILNAHKDNAIWSEGILMYIMPMEMSDEMIHKVRDGEEEHYFGIFYADMPEFKPTLDGDHGMKISVTMGGSKVLTNLAKWVKEQES